MDGPVQRTAWRTGVGGAPTWGADRRAARAVAGWNLCGPGGDVSIRELSRDPPMHSTALALNWQIWGRHRWGFAGTLVIVAGICAMPQAYPPAKLTSDVGDTGMPFMMAILM